MTPLTREDRAHAVAQIQRKRQSQEWLDEHRSELRRKFPDRFVAVLDGRVVGADPDFRALLSTLKKKHPAVIPSSAAIEFLGEDEIVWVL